MSCPFSRLVPIKKIVNWTTTNEPLYSKVYQRIPCGQCLYCVNRKVNDWQQRINEEIKISTNVSFVTLTYDDEHLPRINDTPTFSKDDIQKFFKRLRKYLVTYEYKSNKIKIKYLLVAEYGDQEQRPHYHAIIFNLPYNRDFYKQNEIINKNWQKGFTSVISYNTPIINYTLRYLFKTKPLFNDFQEEFKPFLLSSRNPAIGANYISDVNSFLESNPQPTIYYLGKSKRPLSQYYLKKIKEYYPDIIPNTFKLLNSIKYESNPEEYINHHCRRIAIHAKNNLEFLQKQKFQSPKIETYKQILDEATRISNLEHNEKTDLNFLNKLIAKLNHGPNQSQIT